MTKQQQVRDPPRILSILQLYSGVAGIIVLWTCIAIGMYKARLGFLDQRPISYLGVNQSTQTLFSLSLVVSALLFISFGLYIQQIFQVKNRFILYFLIGQLGQIVAALIPDTASSRYKLIHTTAAFILAFSLPLLISQFSLSQSNAQAYHLYIRLLRFEQITFVVGISLFIFVKGIAPLGEVLPTIGFHLWIVILTYKLMKMKRFVS